MQDASTRLAAMQVMLERWRGTSMLDTESGAHSRPFGLEVLTLHFNRCVRLRAPLSLAVVGVEVHAPPTDGPADLFVSNVLSAVSRVLEGQVRAMDTVARFDRFKFMVIFPETAPDGAMARRETPCVVGLAEPEPVRRNSETPGALFSASSSRVSAFRISGPICTALNAASPPSGARRGA